MQTLAGLSQLAPRNATIFGWWSPESNLICTYVYSDTLEQYSKNGKSRSNIIKITHLFDHIQYQFLLVRYFLCARVLLNFRDQKHAENGKLQSPRLSFDAASALLLQCFLGADLEEHPQKSLRPRALTAVYPQKELKTNKASSRHDIAG